MTGDSAGRGLFLGSCLGAVNGSLPTDLAAWEGRAEIQKKLMLVQIRRRR